MRRITVVGPLGSGKSTLAATVAEGLGLPRVDLDEHFHRPGWEPTPTPEFRAHITDVLAVAEAEGGGWVVAGNYLMVADLTQGRSDTIVWLDLPRRVTMPRVAWRTIRRVVRREQLWNGNRESLLTTLHPRDSVLREAWTKHPGYRAKYEQLADTPLWANAHVHRLRSVRQVAGFVDAALAGAG